MRYRWIILIAVALLSPLAALFFGSADLPFNTVWRCLAGLPVDPLDQLIFTDLRLPRVAAGVLVGAGLAIAGASLQNVTRNGLADPYLFGVVAGAGLGASVVTVLMGTMLSQQPLLAWLLGWLPVGTALPLAAFGGALFAVMLVQVLAITSFARSSEQLLLGGVAISLMLGSLTHFILFIGEPFAANKVLFWLMGSLGRVESSQLWLLFPVVLVSSGVLLLLGRHFDAMLLGDDNARTLGVDAVRLRALALVICAALTAAVVAYCGGIGFVGLMIPHIVRRWLGVTTRTLIAGCLLLGSTFLVWVDVIARSAVASQEIPIGIITSALGSVFFLLVMRQRLA
ncbi:MULTISPECIES: iron ABC transporter permease [unclassified Oceanobacter]|jgi:iron complex transport system permease protein|uniref:FecCD family ABC transporter permease n=1 Tax=unclassified Oceanobacter TaxID=2620260 RepID=UPI0026E33E8D|nr:MULTISPECIES: iron ABC transporter permease [unclassified Oceanobacter]MDO6681004.1 iron ABC transporter permease [Oceanobacter sp. 5_MG-2023]MDP2504424.1 iron ABC transporter permease [Oceanobacter sp. 3_MG-2023]MDP2608665.1 iron ABC transporter permease [Oceanobacter sp. 1_MG-2023]MDP2611761.1 iron ABC transporter permease [Oceanobacter sp. 2_MG-2023]